MEEPVTIFDERAARFTALLGGVGDAWDAPTPCEGWSVADVVRHVIATERDFFASRGLELPPEPDGAAPPDAWRTHLDAVQATLRTDDVPSTSYDGYFGPTTIGDTLVDFYGFDLVVHGWDIAAATGQEWTISDVEIERLHRNADGWGPALRQPGVCGPEVPVAADATAQEQLLGRLGRDPHWSGR